MHCTKQIKDDLFWIGGNDRRLRLFENVFPIPNGVSYNSYLLMDEKTVLIDTVDRAITDIFLENVRHILGERPLDYIVVNHMEPDHCATLVDLLRIYPQAAVVGNTMTFKMITQFYGIELQNKQVVTDGDTLKCGRHTLRFLTMPMVHWPEVMGIFDETDHTVFSADAFGSFGALSGHLFADEVDYERDWMDESRRYYSNIVGKYGQQVQDALGKILPLEPRMICPLHGHVWRRDLNVLVEKYGYWSRYVPEESGVVIAYGSIYGNTENAANVLAGFLADAGVKNIRLHDVSGSDPSYIISDIFRFSHLVLASSTYNNGIFSNMENLLHDLSAHKVQNRKVSVIQNGSWFPNSGKLMQEILSTMSGMEILGETVTLRSALAPGQEEELAQLADVIAQNMRELP